MSLVITPYLVRESDVAYASDLNGAIDFIDLSLSNLEADIDSIGDAGTWEDCKRIAVGDEITDGKHSSEYYFNEALTLLSHDGPVSVGGSNMLSVKKVVEEVDRYHNGSGLITDLLSGQAYGYSVSTYNSSASNIMSEVSGTKPTLPDGSQSNLYSVGAYFDEVDDIAHNTTSSVRTAASGTVEMNTCKTIEAAVATYW